MIHFLLQETGKVRDNSDWERSSFVMGRGRGVRAWARLFWAKGARRSASLALAKLL